MSELEALYRQYLQFSEDVRSQILDGAGGWISEQEFTVRLKQLPATKFHEVMELLELGFDRVHAATEEELDEFCRRPRST